MEGRVAASNGAARRTRLSFDPAEAEQRLALEQTREELTPEQSFDRRWALTLIQRAFVDLETAYAGRGKRQIFETLKPYLEWNRGEITYAEAARTLDMTENAVQQAVFRLRRQFRRVIEREVAETVDSQAELQREIDCLIEALG